MYFYFLQDTPGALYHFNFRCCLPTRGVCYQPMLCTCTLSCALWIWYRSCQSLCTITQFVLLRNCVDYCRFGQPSCNHTKNLVTELFRWEFSTHRPKRLLASLLKLISYSLPTSDIFCVTRRIFRHRVAISCSRPNNFSNQKSLFSVLFTSSMESCNTTTINEYLYCTSFSCLQYLLRASCRQPRQLHKV